MTNQQWRVNDQFQRKSKPDIPALEEGSQELEKTVLED